MLHVSNLTSFFVYKLDQVPEWIKGNPFYSNLFTLWSKYHAFSPHSEGEIRREIIWSNKFITSAGAPMRWKAWESKGIVSINDLCHPDEGRLCSHTEIQEKYNVSCSFLDALTIRLSIPIAWRRALTVDWSDPPLPNSLSGVEVLLPGEKPIDVLAANSKVMYEALISQRSTSSTAFQHWSESTNHHLQISNGEEWREANLSVYRATRETKLQSLHFRVMNRILPCNKFLRQIGIKTSDVCDLCGQVDSIIHFLFECQTVQIFWTVLCGWFNGVDNLALALDSLSPKLFLFGVPKTFNKVPLVNFVLMNAKFYIYRQRLFHEGRLELPQWLSEFKVKLLMERQINSIEGKAHRFKRWLPVLNAIG